MMCSAYYPPFLGRCQGEDNNNNNNRATTKEKPEMRGRTMPKRPHDDDNDDNYDDDYDLYIIGAVCLSVRHIFHYFPVCV